MKSKDAWIHMTEDPEAEGELKDYYNEMMDPNIGEVDHIIRIHGQNPPTLQAHFY